MNFQVMQRMEFSTACWTGNAIPMLLLNMLFQNVLLHEAAFARIAGIGKQFRVIFTHVEFQSFVERRSVLTMWALLSFRLMSFDMRSKVTQWKLFPAMLTRGS